MKNFLRSRYVGTIGALAVASLVLSACGGAKADDDAAAGGNGDAPGTITVGFPAAIAPLDVPLLEGLKTLEEEGWKTEFIEFDSPDVLTQALVTGDVTVASMGPATVIAANEGGADLKMVALNNAIDLQVVGTPEIETCADLDGQKVAYHSEGSTSTAHLFRYIADNCPEIDPDFLVISGSVNRTAALLGGQISGTIVRLQDWAAATENDPDSGHILASLSDEQGTLLTQTLVVNGQRLDEERDGIVALLAALDKQFEAANSDPAAYAEIATKHLDTPVEELASVLSVLIDSNIFPAESALNPSSVDDSIEFYKDAGVIEGELSAEDIADFSLAGEAAK